MKEKEGKKESEEEKYRRERERENPGGRVARVFRLRAGSLGFDSRPRWTQKHLLTKRTF